MVLRTNAAFNRSVWFYDGLARLIFGGVIRQSQICFLSFIPAQASVLIVGGGTGWILQDLAQLQIPLQITYLEASPSMLAKARQVARQLSSNFLKIHFRQGTETALRHDEIFNVVFTPFVLDLYPDEQVWQMINNLQVHLKAGGLWLLSDFVIAAELRGWPKWWRSGVIKMMYVFFSWIEGLTTKRLPDISLQFQKFPLELVTSHPFLGGFIQAQVYQKTSLSIITD